MQGRICRRDMIRSSNSSVAKLDLTDTIKDGAKVVLTDAAIRRQLILAFTEDSRLHVREVSNCMVLNN